MKTFTPTEIQKKGVNLYNAVQAYGIAGIKHQGRPDMVVMTAERLEGILHSDTMRESFIESRESGEDISAIMIRIGKAIKE